MRHTFIWLYVHVVFSTKNRRGLISNGIRDPLWAYMGGIARKNGVHALKIGGMPDHVHLLLALASMVFNRGSGARDQGRLQLVGPRKPQSFVLLAGGIWSIQRKRLASSECDALYRESGAASSEDDLCGGVATIRRKTPG
jgi:hypothetical protein